MTRPRTSPRLRIAVTSGEPAGIGPDLCVALASKACPADIVVLGSAALLKSRAVDLKTDIDIAVFDPRRPISSPLSGTLRVLDIQTPMPVQAGRLDPSNSPHVLEMLTRAVDGCREGLFHAMVTAPVHKGIINDAGFPFTGHTEFLARRCGEVTPVMLLTAPGLRVALATTHIPLRCVPDALNRQGLEKVIRILNNDLQTRFGLATPKILVCALNPHAGEGGHLGREEIEVIEPVLRLLRAQGMALRGPLPADTAFTPANLAGSDVVLTMYHDQGLPVLKHAGFGASVNVTLGLPIIRTSVDHGTALDLAATGKADPGSMFAAVATAIELANVGFRGAR